MLAPRPAGTFVNENEVGAPTQGAKKGLQAKRGLNGPPLLSCDACAHHKLSRFHTHTHRSGCHLIIFTRTHPGRALGNVTNGAKPTPQQQVRPRAILGDISNRAAAPALSAGAKKEELPPVECLHVSDPAPPASFDLTSSARPEAVARAVAEHRAPIFGATARDAGVLEQVRVPSPWAAGASPGPMPTFRGVPPSPFGAEAPQLGQKSAPISHVGSEVQRVSGGARLGLPRHGAELRALPPATLIATSRRRSRPRWSWTRASRCSRRSSRDCRSPPSTTRTRIWSSRTESARRGCVGVGVGGDWRVRAALSAALPREVRGEVRGASCARGRRRRSCDRGWTLHCVSLTGEVDRRRKRRRRVVLRVRIACSVRSI